MKLSRIIFVFFVVIVFGFSFFARFLPSVETGDGRSLRWERYDVTESYVIYIENGPYSFGFAEIPTNRLNSIENVTVSDNGVALTQGCLDFAHYYCVTNEEKLLSLRYYFRSAANTGERRNIEIRYTVYGALRSYEDGDQLYWVAIPGDREFPVDNALITVNMPPNTPIDKIASYPDDWDENIQGNRITWQSPGVMQEGDEIEVRVQYPHNSSMEKPDWQAGYDWERFYIENIQPFVSVLLVILGAVIR